MSDLGSRWVAALGDKAWAPGMLWHSPAPELWEGRHDGTRLPPGAVPDFGDDATKGAALGVLRKLLDSPTFRTDALHVCRREDGRWEAWTDTHAYEWGCGGSEAEVLVGLAEAWKRGQR